jgi:hypothetical protein
MSTNTERFLERATAGLATDPELRLDVQAELRSHIEDKTAELGGEEHADEAVASLGGVVELAEEVSEANQRRLGWRNLARRVLRLGLVPASIVCMVLFFDISGTLANERIKWLMTGADILGPADGKVRPRAVRKNNPLNILYWAKFLQRSRLPNFDSNYSPFRQSAVMRWLERSPDLTERRRMLLCNWSNQAPEDNRALWDSAPTNRVYLADYMSRYGIPGANRNRSLLDEACSLDPSNARYPLVIAMASAERAARLKADSSADAPPTYWLEVSDRPGLDQSMAALLEVLSKPEFHRYHLEMLQERLAALGPTERMADANRRVLVASSVLLPDLQAIRSAARHALAYARLLVDEGHPQEALPYLRVPERLNAMLLPDSFCLIDTLVCGAMLNMALEIVPGLLHQMGRNAEAGATKKRLTALLEPMRQYRERRDVDRQKLTRILDQHSGPVARRFLSSLSGQDLSDLGRKLAPSRRLEFTVLTEGIVALLECLLLIAMLACLAVVLRWRWALGSHASPLLLLPSWRDLLRFALLGMVVPFAVFLAWTLWSPWSGQAYGLKYAGHRTAGELVLLAAAFLVLPAWLALRAFRRRCVELELAQPHRLPRLLTWLLLAVTLVPLVGAMVPPGSKDRVALGGAIVGTGTIILAVSFVIAFVVALAVPRLHGRVLGTLSRSLIPVFALAALMLSLIVQPILQAQERRFLRADTLVWSTEEAGFTPFETRLVTQLRGAMLQVMAANPMPTIPTTKAQP